jgi:nitroreductase
MPENTTIRTICNHRSIRKYKTSSVGKSTIDRILHAAQRAASGCNFQNYSFIQIEGLKTRKKILKAIRPFIGSDSFADAPVWIVVCVDLYRLRRLLESQDVEYRPYFGYKVRSIVDAALAAENLVIAAESLGLGTLMVGMVFEAMVSVSGILCLPRGVTPLLMVCIGIPDENPPLRPRWPLSKIRHINRYREVNSRDIADYMKTYNTFQRKERRRPGSYGDHLDWLMKTPLKNRHNEIRIRRLIHANGLSL